MLDQGWIDEVKKLLADFPNEHLYPLDSIGYRQIIAYLDRELTKEDLEEEIMIKTRQFAKRQIQWFSKETVDLKVEMRSDRSLDKITQFILDKT